MDGVAEPPETLAEVPSGVTSPFPEDFEPGEATSPFPEDFEPEDAVESGGTADATAQKPESSQTPERRQSTGDDALDDFVAAAQSAAVPEPAVVVTPRATELAIAVELRAIEAFMASAYSLVESGEHDLRLGNSESSFRFTPRFKRPTASAQDAGEPEDGGEEVEGEELPIGREDDGEPNASFDRTEPAAEPEAPRTAIDAGPAEIDESNTGQGMPQARADYQALAATPPAPPEAPVADPRAPAAPASPADPPAIMPGYPAQPSAPEPVDGRRRFSSWLQSLRRRA
jgi:hypothetical protein